MDYTKRHAILFNKERISELIPVEAYDDEEGLFFINGDRDYLGAVFLGSALVGADDGTTSMIKSAFSGDMPDDSMVQISHLSSNFIENMVNLYGNGRDDLLRRRDGLTRNQKEVLYGLYESRREFIREGAYRPLIESSGVRLKNTMIIMSIKIPVSKTPNQRELDDVRAAVMRFRESMKSVGLGPTPLDAQTYLVVMRAILNMGNDPDRWYDEDRLINEQVCSFDTDIENTKHYVRIKDNYIRSLSTQNFPDMVSLGLLNQLIGDPNGSHNQITDPFMFTLNIYFPQQAAAIKSIKQKQTAIHYQAQGPWAKYVARIRSKEEGFSAMDEAMEQGNRPVKCWFNTLLFSENPDESQRSASRLRTHFQMHGYEMYEDTHMHGPFLMLQLPLGQEVEAVGKTHRYFTMTVREAAQLPPIIGEWKGTGRGAALIFFGRRGQILLYDLFDSDTSMNCVIAATSGAGKSFLANDLISGYLQKGAIVRVIDQGRSYEKLCDSIEGQYIAFDADTTISLNPFTHVKDIDDEITLLCVIVAKMASPTSGFNDWEMSQTAQILKELWDEFGPKMNITDVSERFNKKGLDNNHDHRLLNISQQLYQYTRHGAYGKYFDGPNNLDYSNNMVVLELDDLRSKPDLQQVVLLQLIAQIQTECYLGERSVPKIVLIDEAWEAMMDPMVAKFLEGSYRRFRKFNSACIMVTQSLDDLYNSASGEAIAKNSPNTILLQQTGESVDGLKQSGRFRIGEYGFSQLRSVRTERGKYSDVLVRSGDAWGVGRFVVDRYTQLMYSTKAEEVAAIKAMRDRGLSVREAIEAYIAEEKSVAEKTINQKKRGRAA